MSGHSRRHIGKHGEDIAVRFLASRGFSILHRNFATPFGEIDLVGKQAAYIVFVEVKTRADESYAEAQNAVTPKKQGRLIRTAKYFLKIYKVKDRPLRFDVVAVVLGHKGRPQIRHYKNAFKP